MQVLHWYHANSGFCSLSLYSHIRQNICCKLVGFFFLWLACCVDLLESMNWVWNHSTLSEQQWTSVCRREGLRFGGHRAQQSSYELLSQFIEAKPWKGNWWFLPGSGYWLLQKKAPVQADWCGARWKSELIWWVELKPLCKRHTRRKMKDPEVVGE